VGREAAGLEVSTEPIPEMPDFWEGLQWDALGFFVQSCGRSACVPPLHYPASLAWMFRSSRSTFFPQYITLIGHVHHSIVSMWNCLHIETLIIHHHQCIIRFKR